ncbi:MAG: crcB-like protein [Segetibacter sp.]|nr:crcB-like protein [Segetibacter sp.]
MFIKNLFIVGLGGMLGSMLRYVFYTIIKGNTFPFATLTVNILGSLIIGLVAGVALKNATFNNDWRLFLATGICGGFTTFSAFSLECMEMMQQNRYAATAIYIATSIIAGLAAAVAGVWLSRQLV